MIDVVTEQEIEDALKEVKDEDAKIVLQRLYEEVKSLSKFCSLVHDYCDCWR